MQKKSIAKLIAMLFFQAHEPVKNVKRSGIFFTINHLLCGWWAIAYSKKKLSSKVYNKIVQVYCVTPRRKAESQIKITR